MILKGKFIRLECDYDIDFECYNRACDWESKQIDFTGLTFKKIIEDAKNLGWIFKGKKYICPCCINKLKNKKGY